MERSAMKDLVAWKNRSDRKPLLLQGARQVGKTWLMKEFGRLHFESVVYIDFEANPRMALLFGPDASLDPERILRALSIETGMPVDPKRTLLIFDEIQAAPRALTSLKYFSENLPDQAVLAAGSLLGVAVHPSVSWPVGKIDLLDLRPLSFLEFLRAIGQPQFAEIIDHEDWSMMSSFHDRLVEYLKAYLVVGGMPEPVAAYRDAKSLEEVRSIQRRILASYELDFSKHAPTSTIPRIRMLWQSLPTQLAREHRKFLYDLVKEGARAREYEMALLWLSDCGLIHRIARVTKPCMPLKAYIDLKAFKLFCLDVGLLSVLSGLDPKAVLENDRVFVEFKGALTEQYVLQQLLATKTGSDRIVTTYWSSESSQAEVDFVLQLPEGIVPVEVKANINLQAKSLQVYRKEFAPPLCIRTSLARRKEGDGIVDVPLYAASRIPFALPKEDLPPLQSRGS